MLLKGQGKKRTISSSLATSKGALYVGIRVLHWTTRYFDLYTTTDASIYLLLHNGLIPNIYKKD